MFRCQNKKQSKPKRLTLGVWESIGERYRSNEESESIFVGSRSQPRDEERFSQIKIEAKENESRGKPDQLFGRRRPGERATERGFRGGHPASRMSPTPKIISESKA